MLVAVLVAAVAIVAGTTATGSNHPGAPVTVTVDAASIGPVVAPGFLGLSFEDSSIPLVAQYAHTGNLVALMRSIGPGVLRFGGVSADADVSWSPDGRLPAWAKTAITPGDLAGLATLARKSGWSVLLTVGLGHYNPAEAAAEVGAAVRLLGPSFVGVEVGNEPDRFAREGLRAGGWDFAKYAGQLGAYRAAIAKVAPALPVLAPDASGGIRPLSWVQAAAGLHPAQLTDHYYPLSSCDGSQPVVGELLGTAIRSQESDMLGRLRAIERATGQRIRIDETNNISCRGEAGVSNTFASALWAVDWIMRAMQVGFAGLNFHDLLTDAGAYSPLVLSTALPGPSTAPQAARQPARPGGGLVAAALHPNPEWYALLLASHLVGQRPLATSVNGSSAISAGAFVGQGQVPNRMTLAVVDFDPPGAANRRVRLHVPARFTAGSVIRLTGPAPAATGGVRLGGAEVASDGVWTPVQSSSLTGSPGAGILLQMRPSSAALVTLRSVGATPYR
jgi:hypothetical protein